LEDLQEKGGENFEILTRKFLGPEEEHPFYLVKDYLLNNSQDEFIRVLQMQQNRTFRPGMYK
jgi:hypothetical protein